MKGSHTYQDRYVSSNQIGSDNSKEKRVGLTNIR